MANNNLETMTDKIEPALTPDDGESATVHVRFTHSERTITMAALVRMKGRERRLVGPVVWFGNVNAFARLRAMVRQDDLRRFDGQMPKTRRRKRGGKRLL